MRSDRNTEGVVVEGTGWGHSSPADSRLWGVYTLNTARQIPKTVHQSGTDDSL